MALVTTEELITEAATSGRAIGAFNVLHLETVEALAAGAEASGLPLILAISQNCIAYHGGPDAIMAATLAVARNSSARLSVHLDHIEDEELAERGLELGASSVMFDASRLPYDENVALTAAVARRAHARGATLEGELGEVGGKDGAHAPGVRTDPDEAHAFVAATGIDTLAVAVGTTHARTTRDASIDLDLIERLAASAGVPLVLHGSSSLDDETLGDATAHGITKVNISTHLNGAFTGAVREWLADNPAGVDSRRYLGAGRDAIAAESARLQRLLAARPGHV